MAEMQLAAIFAVDLGGEEACAVVELGCGGDVLVSGAGEVEGRAQHTGTFLVVVGGGEEGRVVRAEVGD